jgi:hypothetical protein
MPQIFALSVDDFWVFKKMGSFCSAKLSSAYDDDVISPHILP